MQFGFLHHVYLVEEKEGYFYLNLVTLLVEEVQEMPLYYFAISLASSPHLAVRSKRNSTRIVNTN